MIPRLSGGPKSALLEVQSDEYGGGRAERMHSTLFAKTMRALGLRDGENAYLDQVPGATLATVNLMSAMGLRRERRGAIVGHLAMFEMTSAQPNRRYGNALRRLGFDAEATDFYDEHVEADAVHENIAAAAVRRSSFLSSGAYDGDALFENLELMRTIHVAGGTVSTPLDPPSSRCFRWPPTSRGVDLRLAGAWLSWQGEFATGRTGSVCRRTRCVICVGDTALGTKTNRLVRPVAERANPRAATATQRDHAPLDLDLLAILIEERDRTAD